MDPGFPAASLMGCPMTRSLHSSDACAVAPDRPSMLHASRTQGQYLALHWQDSKTNHCERTFMHAKHRL
eukprot:675655-Amphidinium_carterae.1